MSNESIIIDLSNYKDKVGSRVPEGKYKVIVDDAEMNTSKKGNDMIEVWYRIAEGDQSDQTITDRLTLTPAALFRVVGFMNAIGLPTPKKKLQINLRQFIGKVLEIEVEDGEPYNGRVKSEVRNYIRIAGANKAGAAKSEPEADDLDDLIDDEDDVATDDVDSDDDVDDVDDISEEDEAAEKAAEDKRKADALAKRRAAAKRKKEKEEAEAKKKAEAEDDDDDDLDLDDVDLDDVDLG